MKVLTLSLVAVGLGVAGCTDGGGAGSTTTTAGTSLSDAEVTQICDDLQGTEPIDLPNDPNEHGLAGAIDYVRLRSGPRVEGDLIVYVDGAHPEEVQAVAAQLAAMDQVAVVDTLDQAEALAQLETVLESHGGAVAGLDPDTLPPVVSVTTGTDAAQAAVVALQGTGPIIGVEAAADFASRTDELVGSVYGQFGTELDDLATGAASDPQQAAATLRAVARGELQGDTRLVVIDAIDTLGRFILDACTG